MPNEKCGLNKLDRRNIGGDGIEIALADQATCPTETDTCCSNEEITHDCSEYAQDGYSCVKKCYDLPQDIPDVNERKSNVNPYQPKEAKCPRNEICCKRKSPIVPEGSGKCESSKGYKCLGLDQCNPNKIVVKKNVAETADLLFNEDNFIDTDSSGGLVVDIGKSPCESADKVCCQPNTKPEIKVAKPIECGKHNQRGLDRGGVPTRYTSNDPNKPVFSLEGEWPHACLVLKKENDELLGGASLIAPKIVVTSAHIVRYV